MSFLGKDGLVYKREFMDYYDPKTRGVNMDGIKNPKNFNVGENYAPTLRAIISGDNELSAYFRRLGKLGGKVAKPRRVFPLEWFNPREQALS